MGELRWVLVGLGAIVLLTIYAWGRGYLRGLIELFRRGRSVATVRKEPSLDSDGSSSQSDADDEPVEAPPAIPEPMERIVTLRVVPRREELAGDVVVLALRKAGLRHGRYGIFHMRLGEAKEEIVSFSVANLTEPGSFDLNNLAQTKIPGMSFFMVLPGAGDPVARFDQMVDTARSLARTLEADLHDEKGSSWSFQRERYVREEMIEYRHQLERSKDMG